MQKSVHVRTSGALLGLKAKAILAGALVLGVGAAVTLASWNDSEVASGAFAGGSFNLQSSTDGSVFTDNPVGQPATLSFSTTATNLSPNTTVYAPFAIQLAAGTTNAARVSVSGVAAGEAALISNLSYTMVTTSSITCDATAVAGGTTILTGSGAASASASDVIDLTSAATPTFLCIAVTGEKDLPQVLTGSLTWSFTAVSTDTAL